MSRDFSSNTQYKWHTLRNLAWVGILLFCIIWAVYMQTGNHQFISYDDDVYVTKNPHVAAGLTSENLRWAFTSVDAANWHPITWLSHMLDVQLYGLNPRGHHLSNVGIHATSSLLLLFLLFRISGALWQSAFVAALFALHPLHVESVAWVAERKDVLSAFFCFLTLNVYAEYTVRRKRSLYVLCLLVFVFGLMSKPMLVTLPLVMLLLDYWPLNRFEICVNDTSPASRWSKTLQVVREKVPFFLCSILSGAVTIFAQHKGGAINSFDQAPFQLRFCNSIVAYVKYLGKTFWPQDLAVLYPLPLSIPLWQILGSLVILTVVTAAVISARHRYPFFIVGWFWFLVTLVPVIGLVQVGSQSMADRYSYIPMTGLLIIVAWGITSFTKAMGHQCLILCLLSGVIISASIALTWKQVGFWRDSVSLYQHTLRVTTGNYTIHYNLGLSLAEKGDFPFAIREYEAALAINPRYAEAHNNLGQALASQGDHYSAIGEYQKAVFLDPKNAAAHSNLGASLAIEKKLNAAIPEFREALRLEPTNAMAHFNLGRALELKGDVDTAIQEYQKGLQLDPGNSMAQTFLAGAIKLKENGQVNPR